MAIDFPAGNAGNSPFDAPNGVTYTWNDDGYWEAQIDSSGGGDGSVGSLQEVTDVGNSTTNDVLAQDFFSRTDSLPSTTNPGFYVGGGNGIYISSDSTSGSATLWQGFSTDAGDQTSRINVDGGASFASGDITLNADGSAEFAGGAVDINTNGAIKVSRSGATDNCFIAALNDTERAIIEADGSAEFAGNIQVGGDPNDGTNAGAKIIPQGMVMAARATGSSASAVWSGFLEGTTDPTSRINADGSSLFFGKMEINMGDNPVLDLYRATTSVGGGVFRIYSDVGDTKRRSFAITADGTTSIGGVDNSGAPNIALNADGSGTFAGSIQSGGAAYDGSLGFRTSAFGTVYVCSVETTGVGSNGAIWQGYTEGSGTSTSTIFSDGSAVFSEQVNSGEPETGKWRTDANWGFTAAFENNGSGFAAYWNNAHSTPSAPYLLRGVVNGVNTAEIHSDGSATFSGAINGNFTGNYLPVGDLSNSLVLRGDQIVFASQDGSDCYGHFASDGSANFAGNITSNDDPSGGINVGAVLYGDQGTVAACADGDVSVWSAWSKGTTAATSTIHANGNANFAGIVFADERVDVGSNYMQQDGCRLNNFGVIQVRRDGATEDAFQVLQDGNEVSNAKVRIKNDGSANFAGAVTAATVNGVNVANVGEALTALKTAAAASTNHDELKAAIASALANF